MKHNWKCVTALWKSWQRVGISCVDALMIRKGKCNARHTKCNRVLLEILPANGNENAGRRCWKKEKGIDRTSKRGMGESSAPGHTQYIVGSSAEV